MGRKRLGSFVLVVEHAVAAAKGLLTSRSDVYEPGPRGSLDEERPPRGPGSATIDHHLTAFAAYRRTVRQT
jgi:hypothetical protein